MEMALLFHQTWPAFSMLFSIRQLASHTRFAPASLRPLGMNCLVFQFPADRILGLLLVWATLWSTPASGQNLLSAEPSGSQYPAQEYYLGLQAYRSGDLDAASELFDAALRNGRRDVHGRWIDSIPALAMLAECHWHLGSLQAAHQHLDHAFQIAIRSRGWLGRIDWRSITNGGVQATQPNQWPQTQAVRILPLKRQLMYRSGEPLTEARLARGGVIEEPSIRSIDVVEIMRGFAIASYRRRIILGPLAENDPLASGLLESTKFPAGLDVPVARALIGSVRSTGYFAAGDDKRCVSDASASAMFNGSVHPLSAIVMLTHGSAVAGTDRASGALADLVSTIHIAGALQQPELVGEALQLAAGCANQQDASGVANVARMVSESLHRRSLLASLHGWIAGSDAAVTAGDLDTASMMLGNAQQIASRRNVTLPRLEAYAAYVAARIAAADGSSIGIGQKTAVDEALGHAVDFALNYRFRNQPLVSMPRIYQLNLVQQAVGNSLGNKTGDQLLASYCGDSPIAVWRRDPLDAYAGVIMDRSALHAARVSLTAAQGYGEKLLLAADGLLADRFSSRLPVGGRLLQIRVLARTADTSLDKAALDMLQQVGAPLNALRAAVAAAAFPDAQGLAVLESAVTSIGLGRNELPHVMPPLLKPKLPIASLPERSGLLTFVQVGNKMFGALAVGGKVSMWTIAGSGRLPSEVGRLLRGIGVGKKRGSRLSNDGSWRTAAATLRRQLIPIEQAFDEKQLDELIVVPDGPLWYVPFELLPVADDKGAELLGDRITIRYAPTPGLALQMIDSTNTSRKTGIASGPFFSPKDAELNQSILESITAVIKEPIELAATDNQPSGLLGESIGHFVVAAPRTSTPKRQLMMAVSPQDKSPEHGSLAGWMRFPAQVPRSVILVGLRTPVDGGQMGNGDELFMTLCALNAAGVENILLSRWAVGGESTAVLLRELLQELPFVGMNESWRRARMLLRRSELDPEAEPLLTKADHKVEGLTGDRPLFWSGYLVSAPPANRASEKSAAVDAAEWNVDE